MRRPLFLAILLLASACTPLRPRGSPPGDGSDFDAADAPRADSVPIDGPGRDAPDARTDVVVFDGPTGDTPAMDVPAMDVPAMDAPSDTTPGSDVLDDTPTTDVGADGGCAQTLCSGACVDLQTSVQNCGACGHDCTTLPNVDGTVIRCVAGACNYASACQRGFGDCDGLESTGCEGQLWLNSSCGDCNTACSGSAPVCRPATGDAGGRAYVCDTGCASTQMLCGTAPNQMCADVQTDVLNCGRCGMACPRPANSTASCASGGCTFACNTGYHACGSTCAADNSPMSCGSSCTPCSPPANATATCDGVRCGFTCNSGYHQCGSACVSNTSVASCGSSCTPCAMPANGAATCNGTSCGIQCNSGFQLCGNVCADPNSPTSCGSSCMVCPVPANGSAICALGAFCDIACNTGYHACGDVCASNTSVSTCGASCSPCPAPPANASGMSCDGTQCVPVCNTGYAPNAGQCVSPPAPRPIEPLSTSVVSTTLPFFTFALAAGTDGAVLEASPKADFSTGVITVTTTTTTAVLTAPLTPGVWFWRLHGKSGSVTGASTSPVWELFVRPTSALGNGGVAFEPDFNGDGYADVVVGSPRASGTGVAGSVWVYYGSATGLSGTQSSRYVVLSGASSTDFQFGSALTPAGDLDGDGFGDLVVGTPRASGSGVAGNVWVYYGSATGLSGTQSSSYAVLSGANSADFQYGSALAAAGDLNGDGYADLAVGSPRASTSGVAGSTWVYYGGATGLSGTQSSRYVVLSGATSADFQYGSALAAAGDVNGDGYADLAVGAPRVAGSGTAGTTWVYYGGATGLSGSQSSRYIELSGATSADFQFGSALASAGDVNGDGFVDLAVGAPRAVVSGNPGATWVYYGGATGLSGSQSSRYIELSGATSADFQFGSALASAGDVNGDGFADLAVGTPRASTSGNPGATWVYYGGATGLSGSQSSRYIELSGATSADFQFGSALASAGDVNGDGFADLAVGTPRASGSGNPGATWVYYGGATGLSGSQSSRYVVLSGAGSPDFQFGSALAPAGDVDGDGFADLGVGAPRASGTGFPGTSWVYYGDATGLSGTQSSRYVLLTGASSSDYQFGSIIALNELQEPPAFTLARGLTAPACFAAPAHALPSLRPLSPLAPRCVQ